MATVTITNTGDAPPPPYMYGTGPQTMYGNGQPVQNMYGPPATANVVIVQQPISRCDMGNYRIQHALIPGIILLIIAVINFGAYIYVGVVTNIFHSIIINAFIFFLVTGILSIVASVKSNRGCVIALLVWTVLSIILAFAYLILTSLDLTVAMYFKFQPTITYDSIMLFLNFVAMIADITIMVFASRVLCCGEPGSPGHGQIGVVHAQPGQQQQQLQEPGGAPAAQLQRKY